MIKRYTRLPFLFAVCAAAAVAVAGCSEMQQAENFLLAPQTQQSLAALKSGAMALVCAVADASALAATIETLPGVAGQSVIGTDGKVYVISAKICDTLGGMVAGQGVVP